MKVAQQILHAAPIGFTKSVLKTSTQGELYNCDFWPFANVLTLFRQYKNKTDVIGYTVYLFFG